MAVMLTWLSSDVAGSWRSGSGDLFKISDPVLLLFLPLLAAIWTWLQLPYCLLGVLRHYAKGLLPLWMINNIRDWWTTFKTIFFTLLIFQLNGSVNLGVVTISWSVLQVNLHCMYFNEMQILADRKEGRDFDTGAQEGMCLLRRFVFFFFAGDRAAVMLKGPIFSDSLTAVVFCLITSWQRLWGRAMQSVSINKRLKQIDLSG